MSPVQEELRWFARRRLRVLLELLLCTDAAALLVLLAPQVDGAGPEAQTIFLAVLSLLGLAVVKLTPQLFPVALFRCPRCTHRFHAARRGPRRPVISLRACAHCGLALPGSDSSTA